MTGTRQTTDLRQDAADKVAAFLDLYAVEFRQDVEPGAPVDVDSLQQAVRAALAATEKVTRPSAQADLTGVVRGVLDAYARASRSDRSLTRDGARGSAWSARPRLRAAFDRALVAFPQAADLADAESQLADLESTYAEALAALEAAVASGDVEEVMRLRGGVEVSLPTSIAETRARVLALQVAEAQTQETDPTTRAREFRTAAEEARQAYTRAQRQAELALAGYRAADTIADTARDLARDATARTGALREQHQALTANLAADQTRRLRRLAGLPDVEAVPA